MDNSSGLVSLTGSNFSLISEENLFPEKDLKSGKIIRKLLEIIPIDLDEKWDKAGIVLSRVNQIKVIEIHLGSRVYFGRLASLQQVKGINVLEVEIFLLKKSEIATIFSAADISNFLLTNCYEPMVIKEGECDLVWFSFEKGHVVVIF